MLGDNAEVIEARLGARVTVRRIAVREAEKRRRVEVDPRLVTTDVSQVLEDPACEIVVELIGGEEPARQYLLRAIEKQRHIVTAYEEALKKLRSGVVEMAGVAETQMDGALACLVQRDPDLAGQVVRGDGRLDREEQEIEADCLRLLVLRQPVADDLREVMAALKMAGNLERIGDYAANIAKRSAALRGLPDSSALTALQARQSAEVLRLAVGLAGPAPYFAART